MSTDCPAGGFTFLRFNSKCDPLATVVLLKLIGSHDFDSVWSEIWGLRSALVTWLLCSSNSCSSAVGYGVVVCQVFVLTCLDQRQVSNPASVPFVNMLTWSQSNFNRIVSQPVIKRTSAFFSPRSHKLLPESRSQRRSDENWFPDSEIRLIDMLLSG